MGAARKGVERFRKRRKEVSIDYLKSFRSGKLELGDFDIEVWYGDGDCNSIGPIQAEMIGFVDYKQLCKGELKCRITDQFWLDETGFDFEFSCQQLRHDRLVGRDSYAWCFVGQGGKPNKWW